MLTVPQVNELLTIAPIDRTIRMRISSADGSPIVNRITVDFIVKDTGKLKMTLKYQWNGDEWVQVA